MDPSVEFVQVLRDHVQVVSVVAVLHRSADPPRSWRHFGDGLRWNESGFEIRSDPTPGSNLSTDVDALVVADAKGSPPATGPVSVGHVEFEPADLAVLEQVVRQESVEPALWSGSAFSAPCQFFAFTSLPRCISPTSLSASVLVR
jgi:hypothetical protein